MKHRGGKSSFWELSMIDSIDKSPVDWLDFELRKRWLLTALYNSEGSLPLFLIIQDKYFLFVMFV